MSANAGMDMMASLGDGLAHALRRWLLILIMCDVALLTAQVALCPAFFRMPGALDYLIEPLAPLVVYAVVISALPLITQRIPGALIALRVGAVIGVIGGCIEVVSTALESLFPLSQAVVTSVTGAAMLSLFLLFGVAGFIGARRAGSFWPGLLSAIWSAMCAILLVIAFGFLIALTSLPTLAHDMIGDPDYARSGWTDARAFAIANTFDAGFTHLVEAPIIAALLGAVGSGAGCLVAQRNRSSGEQD